MRGEKALAATDGTWYHAGDTRGVQTLVLWLGRSSSKDVLAIDIFAPPTKNDSPS